MINVRLDTNIDNFKNDFMEMVRAFNSDNDETAIDARYLSIFIEEKDKTIEIIINSALNHSNNVNNSPISSNDNKFGNAFILREIDGNYCRQYLRSVDILSYGDRAMSIAKRLSKVVLYEELSEATGLDLPYGALTGIRPTKLYREMREDSEYFRDILHVSSEKLSLIHDIVHEQGQYYVTSNDVVDIFINIPFCTTRCSYCSFISAEIGRVKKYIDAYVDSLVREIDDVKRIVNDNNYKVRAVYIGGGTPTSLDDEHFRRVLSRCDFGADEFTVEAGRPDSITSEKLRIMNDAGVTRISINPQSFRQKTLDIIGRHHSVDEIYSVFNEARRYPFDINMDLIAMLPEESLDDFVYSVNEAIRLDPDNITVHTLSLKKGSKLKESGYERDMSSLAEQMIHYSRIALTEAGYAPYYMYRQKYMSGNLENAGYARDGKVCLYNIDIMEESLSIIANGAGGISKRCFADENRLERLAGAKGIDVYLERVDDMLTKKYEFFKR